MVAPCAFFHVDFVQGIPAAPIHPDQPLSSKGMRSIRFLPLLLLVPALSGDGVAQSPETAHNSRNAIDWAGTYTGTLPCADCPGIATTVTLRSDGSYRMEMVYLERNVAPFVEEGSCIWLPDGNTIACSKDDCSKGREQRYLVGKNRLILLDGEGRRITGDLADRFVLKKSAGR